MIPITATGALTSATPHSSRGNKLDHEPRGGLRIEIGDPTVTGAVTPDGTLKEDQLMTRYLLAVVFVLGAGCGGGDDDDPGTCELGQSQGCSCTSGGNGTQFCDDSGNFGECGMCGPVDPDPNAANFRAEIIPIMVRSCGSGSTV